MAVRPGSRQANPDDRDPDRLTLGLADAAGWDFGAVRILGESGYVGVWSYGQQMGGAQPGGQVILRPPSR